MLAGQCSGMGQYTHASTHEALQDGFERAVWLILIGQWPLVSLEGRLYFHRDTRCVHTRLEPHITIDVLSMETPSQAVSDLYKQLKSRWGFGGRGNKRDRSAALLAIAALEVKEIEGVPSGKRGFLKRVLKRWESVAAQYNEDPHKYTTIGAVRKVLSRIEEAYKEQVSAIWGDRDRFPELFR